MARELRLKWSNLLPNALSTRHLALLALFTGASCIGTSALFVKVSETGPLSTAFWRVFLALPFLWLWVFKQNRAQLTQERSAKAPCLPLRGLITAGAFFAGDLSVWHTAIILTSVANATLLANLAPIFVTLACWLLWQQRPSRRFVLGLMAALCGVILLIKGHFPHTGKALWGDALGLLTAFFYAGYQLIVARLRPFVSTAHIMAVSSTVTAVLLLPIVVLSGEGLLPQSAYGWSLLVALALISQVIGQSLIAYAMAHLPAMLCSVGLLLQPVMAGLFAWGLLGESLGPSALVGALLVLWGIRLAQSPIQPAAVAQEPYNRIKNKQPSS
ncbi:MAG: DMT family transporter [Betaproteobacteria bacterium]